MFGNEDRGETPSSSDNPARTVYDAARKPDEFVQPGFAPAGDDTPPDGSLLSYDSHPAPAWLGHVRPSASTVVATTTPDRPGRRHGPCSAPLAGSPDRGR